ncbi:conserved Plasmodium protein, unknown function [Plasmodium ovale]|uniref:Uncharacterized protein n=1 Tax=Plasmodium ovale TaxID=36330 RepID=A0A1D3UAZ8_PLAOA|nr:conserved Plasmodium protein, unknown function [Plasmodium ovale]
MKRERNKPLNESIGKKKRNDEKAIGTEKNEKNGDAFNPHLSARELKKIQYYENMFKKMEKRKEENYSEVDSKIKRKSSNSRKTKKEEEADKKDENKADNTNGKEVCRKEESEDENKNEYANANARAYEEGKDFKSHEFLLKNVGAIAGEDFTGKDITRREMNLVTDVAKSNYMGNHSRIEQKQKEKKELLEVKKKNVSKEFPNAGIFRREISNKKKNGLHYNLFSSDESEKETRKLNDTDKIYPNNRSRFCCNSRQIFNSSPDREVNDNICNGKSNHTMADIRKEKMKKAQEKEITQEMAKGRGLGTNTRMHIKLDKGHESDSTVNYNNPMHYVNFQMYNNQRRRKGKMMMLKVKRSFSANSSINEYYLDADSVHQKSTYDSSTSGNEYVRSNKYHSHTSHNKKRDALNLRTSDIQGEKSINMKNKWQDNGELKNEICYFGHSTQNNKNNNWNYQNSYTKSFIESKDSFDLYLNDKEYIDENMNTKSNSTEYFNDEIVTNKKPFSSKNFNHKSSSESNRTNCVNKKYDVNFCIRKYLNRMRHTNLKKLKKVNKANVNLYVKSCTNFLNFNKFDSAILSLRKFQNTLQQEEERIAMDSSKGM